MAKPLMVGERDEREVDPALAAALQAQSAMDAGAPPAGAPSSRVPSYDVNAAIAQQAAQDDQAERAAERAFRAGLTPQQRSQRTLVLDAEERRRGSMTPEQRAAASLAEEEFQRRRARGFAGPPVSPAMMAGPRPPAKQECDCSKK